MGPVERGPHRPFEIAGGRADRRALVRAPVLVEPSAYAKRAHRRELASAKSLFEISPSAQNKAMLVARERCCTPTDGPRRFCELSRFANAAGWPSPLSVFVGMSTNESQQSFPRPHVFIAGTAIEANRLTLLPAEVASVMRLGETEVRKMIRLGELSDVSFDRTPRLDPDEVIKAVEERVRRGELEAHVFVELAALVAGRL